MVNATIVNVVATANLNQEVDLYELAKLKEITYDQEIYGGRVAYLKTSEMEGKVSIFPSGKMISIGTRSEKRAFAELEHVQRFLIERQIISCPTLLVPKVQNIVLTADFEENINLEELSQSEKMIYEPEQFPGGILRLEEPCNTTILLFASGKAVIAGLKSSKQIRPIIERLTEIIRGHSI